jgi:Ca-activated chloride channel family protein
VRFGHPWWLAGGLTACLLLIWVWRIADAKQRIALEKFVSPHLRSELTQSISVMRRRAQRGLYLAAVALLFTALAGPLVGSSWVEISRRGNEIVFAVDTSRSMLTPDVKPNRLARAKLAIDDFTDRLDGDAVGIVAFAGSAFLVCPLTLDYSAFHESLGAIDTNTIPRGGTNIASAIREAQVALRRRPGSDKILILVTDGEDLEGSALAAAEAAKQQDGLKIFAVGVGTAGGELIPIPPEQGGGFVKDETGTYVKSRLDESALKAIAAATGGFYVPLGTQGEGLETISKSVLGTLVKHDLASRQQKVYIERYQWPLAASLAALLSSLLVGTRRSARARARALRRAAGGVTATSCLLALMLIPMHRSHAAAPTAEAVYNSGTAAYRAGQFPQAAQAFQQAINQAPSSAAQRLADQEDAYYNLGNALYRTGQKTEQASKEETLQKWTEAVKAYETALQLRPEDADSKYNRDLVKRKIEALKQQQNQNQNQSQDPQQKQGQNPPQNSGQGKGKGQPPPQGQPPQGQQPPAQGQPPGEEQPPAQGQPPAGQPPGQGQPPPQDQPPPQGKPPGPGQPPANPPRNAQSGGNPDSQDGDARAADDQRPPGQMSREEARELLDSVKSDERRPPGTPLARRGAVDPPPDDPLKNW